MSSAVDTEAQNLDASLKRTFGTGKFLMGRFNDRSSGFIRKFEFLFSVRETNVPNVASS